PGTGMRIDYSDEALATLSEFDLDEAAGAGSVLHPNDLIEYFSNSRLASAFASGPVDWNLDGNPASQHAAADLDNDNGTPNNSLSGFDDWAYIHSYIRLPAYQAESVDRAASVE